MTWRADNGAGGGGGGGTGGNPPDAYYVTTTGNDSNSGRTWDDAFLTVAHGLSVVNGLNAGQLYIGPGQFPVAATLTINQATQVFGYGPLDQQQTEIVWTGANNGSYFFVTGNVLSDMSHGHVSGLFLKVDPLGGYTNVNGIYCRNIQNVSYFADIVVDGIPGKGIFADSTSSAIPEEAFPGYVMFERVVIRNCITNWHFLGGYTSLLFLMCSGDVGAQTTDVFIIDPPVPDTGGKYANYAFVGWKSEDIGSGNNGCRYFTVNTDVSIGFVGSSWQKGTPTGSVRAINYTVTPGSLNRSPYFPPVTIQNCLTQNLPAMVTWNSVDILAPTYKIAGESFQVAQWPPDVPDFQAIKAADSFARIDSALVLGPAEDGGVTWSALAGTWGISSNQGYIVTGTTEGLAVVDCGTANGTLTCRVSVSGGAVRIPFRVVDLFQFTAP